MKKKPEFPVKYGVIVGMEDSDVLADEEKIKKAIRGKLKGNLYSSMFSAETGPNTNSFAPWIRRFALTQKKDFLAFVEAMKSIEGVCGVKKGKWPLDQG